jgi:hypothetical protein
MEAGIEPASPPMEYVKVLSTATDLSQLSLSLAQISLHTYKSSEQNIIEKLLTTINSHLQIKAYTLRTAAHVPTQTERDLPVWSKCHVKLSYIHNYLWGILSKPIKSIIARSKIFDCIISLEHIITTNSTSLFSQTNQPSFNKPAKPVFPSIRQQVVTEPKEILDPYEISLTNNYYFPLSDMSPPDT